jgi:hypothetical protein
MTADAYDRWVDVVDREALGEPVTEADLAFARGFERTDPRATAECELWESLATLRPVVDELGDRALANRAVAQVLQSRPAKSGRFRSAVFAGGALAAAAALAFFVSTGAKPALTNAPSGVVELVAAAARTGSGTLTQGASIAEGGTVEAVGGPVCVSIEPRIHACLASGSKLQLARLGSGDRRIDLLAGRVAVALFPLPAGQHFSVVANGVWSTAVGTAFTVELASNGSVETVVHEGKVAVGPEHGGELVTAHKIGLSQGSSVDVTALVSHARTETPDLAALTSVAQRQIEALPLPTGTTAVTPPPAKSVVSPPSEEPSEQVEPRTAARPVHVKDVELPSAEELLAGARQALREQRWSDAAGSYRRLVDAYPASAEAHTVRVPLARLEIQRLGQPAQALKDLEAYLSTSGPLEVEAELAKIDAYRALGDTADEKSTIDSVLSSHPNVLQAAKLRERSAELDAK